MNRFAVDFGPMKRVVPTHYSFRYGSGGDLCCPRNWMLQATNDESLLTVRTSSQNSKTNVFMQQTVTADPLYDPAWITLRRHENDTTLDTSFAASTWVINLPVVSPQGYRIFRLLQFGKNKYFKPDNQGNDGWSDCFVVSAFELFGSLHFSPKNS